MWGDHDSDFVWVSGIGLAVLHGFPVRAGGADGATVGDSGGLEGIACERG